jgi:hypothetical protein
MSSCPPNGRNDFMDAAAGAESQGREYSRFYNVGRCVEVYQAREIGVELLKSSSISLR